jgi:phosphoribosylaminoimidazole-succinocarboxamide synthase
MPAIIKTDLPNPVHSGKVRDTYALGADRLLMVATDRLSAFDVVLPNGIADKGAVLTQLSVFWFNRTGHLVPNHLVSFAPDADETLDPEIARRSMVVRRAERIDIECVVRGYITGSAWSEYKREGTVGGDKMPAGLVEGDRFPEPLFTPTTKAEEGHDEPMTIAEMEDMVGADTTRVLADKTKQIYEYGRKYAAKHGIIIADTKMEFGVIDGRISLIDELLTPDSSRFWDAEKYAPGSSLPNFDKQFVRDWLDAQGWDHEPPAPELPADIVERTRGRYIEAHERLTGESLR